MKENIMSSSQEESNSNNKISPEGLKKEVESHLNSISNSPELEKVLKTAEKIKLIKEKQIVFSDPILVQNGNGVIFPNTINVIQGQSGVHKSRLAEYICAAILRKNGNTNELLGFRRKCEDENITVVYVDTERNIREQFPFALQNIQTKAGYNKNEHPENFQYISLVEIERKSRFKVLKEYLDYLKTKFHTNTLFVVLDVITDCVEDFNRTDKTMELIDHMNMAINELDVVFICIIHENPKSDKARGHLGTEGMNKSSTSIQISFEKDSKNNDTELIKIRYLKCRSTAKFTPFFTKYSDEDNELYLADETDVNSVMNDKRHKADITLVQELIEAYLGDGSKLPRLELIGKLMSAFGASVKTIETRLKEIHSRKLILQNEKLQKCILEKDKPNKEMSYFLQPIDSTTEPEPF